MSTKKIDGKMLKAMLIGGAENIHLSIPEINDLNVFPVPDGDTGTNMSKTVEGGISEISGIEGGSVALVMDKFAHGVLLGARGNSGVILSQIFAGMREVMSEYESVGVIELAEAYRRGVERSYSAVVNPTEGTILTVFRESTEYAASKINASSSVEDFYVCHIEEAKRSLERTKEILPVLTEADVVDSGAAGYLCIAIGMYYALTGKISADSYSFADKASAVNADVDTFTRDSVLEFGYCTEFLLRLTSAKTDPDAFVPAGLIKELEDIGGESIVAYKEGDIVKVHVHTFTPGTALNVAQKYGEFLTLKIENMSISHTEQKPKKTEKPKRKKPYAVIAVATGEGMCSLLSHVGADCIISGGQTSNPSTEEFIEAFDACYAEHIIVLPNNKNVFLAAKQAAELYGNAQVHIIPTENVMQGYGALSVITPGITDIDVLVSNATSAAEGVLGAEVTCAVRDVTIGGVDVKKGDYIAIVGHDITATAESAEDAVCAMLDGLDLDEYAILTLFVGKDVSSERRTALTDRIEEEYPELELTVYEGGQEVYDYLVSLE